MKSCFAIIAFTFLGIFAQAAIPPMAVAANRPLSYEEFSRLDTPQQVAIIKKLQTADIQNPGPVKARAIVAQVMDEALKPYVWLEKAKSEQKREYLRLAQNFMSKTPAADMSTSGSGRRGDY